MDNVSYIKSVIEWFLATRSSPQVSISRSCSLNYDRKPEQSSKSFRNDLKELLYL